MCILRMRRPRTDCPRIRPETNCLAPPSSTVTSVPWDHLDNVPSSLSYRPHAERSPYLSRISSLPSSFCHTLYSPPYSCPCAILMVFRFYDRCSVVHPLSIPLIGHLYRGCDASSLMIFFFFSCTILAFFPGLSGCSTSYAHAIPSYL